MAANRKKKISFNSPVVLWFTIICFVIVVLDYLTSGFVVDTFFMTYRSSLLNPLTYIRLFTHCLGHAGFDHFFNNALYILLLGPMLEEKYGSSTLLVCIVLTAGITGILNNLLFPNTALLGASGICFMMIIMSSITNLEEGKIPLTLILVIILYLGNEIISAVTITDNVSQFAHIIGGLSGAFLGIKLGHGKTNH